ncbi:MAG: hypothetical protein NT069_35745, partial [Planctomycetota bacterium]|nr:hypothetical protein [Planctomycetota bacterium]
MANTKRLNRDSDPCHVLWQVNQIAARVLLSTWMAQMAISTKHLMDLIGCHEIQRDRHESERRSD